MSKKKKEKKKRNGILIRLTHHRATELNTRKKKKKKIYRARPCPVIFFIPPLVTWHSNHSLVLYKTRPRDKYSLNNALNGSTKKVYTLVLERRY